MKNTDNQTVHAQAGQADEVNQVKRQTLKVIGVSGAVVLSPAVAALATDSSLSTWQVPAQDAAEVNQPTNYVIGGPVELSIELLVGPEPQVRITNLTKSVMILRHIYPGMVHAGEVAFDINAIFESSAHGFAAGEGRTFAIEPTHSTQAETDFPRAIYGKGPIRVARLHAFDEQGLVANSSRSFFS